MCWTPSFPKNLPAKYSLKPRLHIKPGRFYEWRDPVTNQIIDGPQPTRPVENQTSGAVDCVGHAGTTRPRSTRRAPHHQKHKKPLAPPVLSDPLMIYEPEELPQRLLLRHGPRPRHCEPQGKVIEVHEDRQLKAKKENKIRLKYVNQEGGGVSGGKGGGTRRRRKMHRGGNYMRGGNPNADVVDARDDSGVVAPVREEAIKGRHVVELGLDGDEHVGDGDGDREDKSPLIAGAWLSLVGG